MSDRALDVSLEGSENSQEDSFPQVVPPVLDLNIEIGTSDDDEESVASVLTAHEPEVRKEVLAGGRVTNFESRRPPDWSHLGRGAAASSLPLDSDEESPVTSDILTAPVALAEEAEPVVHDDDRETARIESAEKSSWLATPRNRCLLLGILLLLLVGGILAGVLVSITGGSDSSSSSAPRPTPRPSLAPTLTLQPTLSGQWVDFGPEIDGKAARDESGTSCQLSTNGTIMAVGSPLNDGNGKDSGHVRVLRWENESWVQLGQDIDGQAVGDMSGRTLALSGDGNVVAVGAGGFDNSRGRVHVYRFDGQEWLQVGQVLEGDEEFDYVGQFSLALSEDGRVVAVGAIQGELGEFGSHGPGYARVYRLDGENRWQQLGQDLVGEEADDEFGFSVALSADGRVAAVGAPRNDASGDRAGQVRVFLEEGGQWMQLGQSINGKAAGDLSGGFISLSADGAVLAVGATQNDDNGKGAGQVRVYTRKSQEWVQLGQDLNGISELDEFGLVSLSSDGSVVAIGAPVSSYVLVFRLDGGRWKQLGQDLVGKSNTLFGSAISLTTDGTMVAVGASRTNGVGANSGSVRVYQLE